MAESWICKICGAQIPEGAKFCGHCGAPQTEEKKECPHCWEELEPDMAFCTHCGRPVSTPPLAEPSTAEKKPKRPGLFGRLKQKPQGEADADGDVQYVDPDKFFAQTPPPSADILSSPLPPQSPAQRAVGIDPGDEDLVDADDDSLEDREGTEQAPFPSDVAVEVATPPPTPAPASQAEPELDAESEVSVAPTGGEEDDEKARFQAEFNADHYYDDRVPADGGHQDDGVGNMNIVPIVLACVGIFAVMFVVIKVALMLL